MSSKILDHTTPVESTPWKAHAPSHAAVVNGYQGPPQPPDPPPGADPPVELPARDEARIRELEDHLRLLQHRLHQDARQARDEGHQAGRAEGVQAGIEQEAAKWTAALARLARSIDELARAKVQFRIEVEEDAVKLALAIARKVLNRELASDPEALVGLARVALSKLNIRELHRVRVHPADAPSIERLLGTQSVPKRVEVVADSTLERGGAVFETERGVLDASVTTQLSEIERGLADLLGSHSR